MRYSLTLASLTLSALALAGGSGALLKPCIGLTAAPVLEEMLPRARAALDIAGTEQVAIDPTRRCIDIQVRTPGTARLVQLLLRGVESPRDAVELRIVEPVAAMGT
jgi:hypothetical protein